MKMSEDDTFLISLLGMVVVAVIALVGLVVYAEVNTKNVDCAKTDGHVAITFDD